MKGNAVLVTDNDQTLLCNDLQKLQPVARIVRAGWVQYSTIVCKIECVFELCDVIKSKVKIATDVMEQM
jgi:hypothetical protein